MKLFTTTLACALFAAALVATPQAQAVTISSGNASVEIDPDSDMGAYDWTVDGVNHLYQMWFWYREGLTAESSIDTLTKVFELTSITGDSYNVVFDNSGAGPATYEIDLTFSLNNGLVGQNLSDLRVDVIINNLSDQELELSFFQYSDFDLAGDSDGDTVEIVGADNAAEQTDGGLAVLESVVGPQPDHHEAAFYSETYDSLTDDSPTTLNDDNGPYTEDVTWAFQWDLVLAPQGDPGSSVAINKDILITPEPASLALFGLGAVAMLKRRR